MKTPVSIRLLVSLCALSAASSASLKAFIYTVVDVGDSFLQPSASSIVHGGSIVSALALLNSPDGVTDVGSNVTAVRPNGDPMTAGFFFSDANNLAAGFNDMYGTRVEIPNGTYSFEFVGGSVDGLVRTYSVDTALMPRAVPKISKQSFTALSSTPVTRSIRIIFPAHRLPAGASAATTRLTINSVDGVDHISFDNLDSKTHGITLPANSLRPNTEYSLELDFLVTSLPQSDKMSPGVYYAVYNTLRFTTQSSSNAPSVTPTDPEEASMDADLVGN